WPQSSESDIPDSAGGRVRMGEYEMGMAVRLFLSSGGQRTIDAADSARLDGPFFLVRRRYPDLNRTETVLTLRSEDVVGADVLKDGGQNRLHSGVRAGANMSRPARRHAIPA